MAGRRRHRKCGCTSENRRRSSRPRIARRRLGSPPRLRRRSLPRLRCRRPRSCSARPRRRPTQRLPCSKKYRRCRCVRRHQTSGRRLRSRLAKRRRRRRSSRRRGRHGRRYRRRVRRCPPRRRCAWARPSFRHTPPGRARRTITPAVSAPTWCCNITGGCDCSVPGRAGRSFAALTRVALTFLRRQLRRRSN